MTDVTHADVAEGQSLLLAISNAMVRLYKTQFGRGTEGMFRETVEELTGRKVRAFVSGIDTVMDVSTEVFYLQPLDRSGATVAVHPPG